MSSLHTLILLIKILHCTHGQTGFEAPTIENVTGTTIGISFNTVEGADEYVVTAAQRYVSSQTVEEIVRGTTTTLLQNLTPSTLYDISIQARNSSADLGRNKTKQQTHPGAPTLTTSTPLPNTFLVFLNTANRARVSQWTVEYRPLGTNISKVVTTEESRYYVLRLVDLQPDTTYQVRGRASQIYNSINLTETEAIFSDWYSFTTDSLSVFARVTFVGGSSTDNTEFGEEWNRVQQELEKSYENLTNLNSLDVVRKENETVYFRLKIKDKSFNDTSTSVYNLNGTQFSNFAVNNGDETIGTPNLSTKEDPLRLRLQYNTSTNMTEGGITDTFVLLSPEETSQAIQIFPVGEVDGTIDPLTNQDEREFSFTEEGTYSLGDGSPFDLEKNTVYGLEPKFIVRDFMKQSDETLYALYYDIPGDESFRFLRTTDMDAISNSSITKASSSDGSSVTISFPSADKAAGYILTRSDGTSWTLGDTDIDGSERLTITVSSLIPGSTYEFNLTTTQRKHDGRTQNVTSDGFIVEPTIDPTTTIVITETPEIITEYTTPVDTAATDTTEGITIVATDTDMFTSFTEYTTPIDTTATDTTEDTTVQPKIDPTTTTVITETAEISTEYTTHIDTPATDTTEDITIVTTGTGTDIPTTFTEYMTPIHTTVTDTTKDKSAVTQYTTETDTAEVPTTSVADTDTEISTNVDKDTIPAVSEDASTEIVTTEDPTTVTTDTGTDISGTRPEDATLVDTSTESAAIENLTTITTGTNTNTHISTAVNEDTTPVNTPTESATTEDLANAATDTGTDMSTNVTENTAPADTSTETNSVEDPTGAVTNSGTEISTNVTDDTTPKYTPNETATTEDLATITTDTNTYISTAANEDTTPVDPLTETIATEDTTTVTIDTGTELTTAINTTPVDTTTEPAITEHPTTVTTDTTTLIPTTISQTEVTAGETTVGTNDTTLPPECNFQSNMTTAFPPERPRLSSTEFVLSWNNVSTNYVVTVKCNDCMDDAQNYRTKTPTMSFDSLKPGVRYRICVIAELCDAGSLVNRTDCETFLTNPPSIGNVSFIVGYSSVIITWDAVPSATSYNARVFLSSLARATQTNQELTNLTRPTATFSNLSPCNAYSVELTASNAGGGSVPVRENFNTSCPSAAPTTSATQLPTTITRTSHPTAIYGDPTASSSYTQITSIASNTSENAPATSTSPRTKSTSNITHSISSDTPVPTKISSNPTTDASNTQPKQAEGTPWWFIFAVVLAIITTVACIAAITWYQKRRTGKFRTTQPQSQSSRA